MISFEILRTIPGIIASGILLAQTPSPKGVIPSPASQPFGLKGDVLGETIQEFHVHNVQMPLGAFDQPVERPLPECTNEKDKRGKLRRTPEQLTLEDQERLAYLKADHKITLDEELEYWKERRKIHLEYWAEARSADVYLTEAEERAGVIKCIAAWSVTDDGHVDDGPTVAGIHAYRTVYSFFHDRLYLIRSELPTDSYPELRQAFVAKYGTPVISIAYYQNGLGVKSAGEELRWKNAVSQINIGEFDAKGNNILLSIWHSALQKECEAAGTLKGREKDL